LSGFVQLIRPLTAPPGFRVQNLVPSFLLCFRFERYVGSEATIHALFCFQLLSAGLNLLPIPTTLNDKALFHTFDLFPAEFSSVRVDHRCKSHLLRFFILNILADIIALFILLLRNFQTLIVQPLPAAKRSVVPCLFSVRNGGAV
jgi:hypothetical protein